MKCYIYCFTNTINNKKYIGSTIKPLNKRYNEHMYCVSHTETHHYNYPLYQAIRKYGIDNFTFEALLEKECSEEEIRKLEREYIIKYNTVSPNGYNQTDNTEHPINTKDAYQKMRETKRENAKQVALVDKDYNILGVWRSIIDYVEENGGSARHIADCCRGERHTVDNKIFLWLNKDGELIIPEYNRNSYKGELSTTQYQKTNKKVSKIDLETNEVIDTYDSLAVAGRMNNCDSSGIAKVCNKKRSKCGGFG